MMVCSNCEDKDKIKIAKLEQDSKKQKKLIEELQMILAGHHAAMGISGDTIVNYSWYKKADKILYGNK